MKSISFLLGAGFSKPANYPLASEINSKFRQLSLEEFYIHTSESAHLTETQNSNWIITQEKHHFVVDFIKFYTESILSSPEEFHYEIFFDYYMQLQRRFQLTDIENEFFQKFRTERNYEWDHSQLLFQFNRTFQQLVANYITIEWPKSISYLKPYTANFPHKNYLELLEYLGEEYKVHIHTLNHDLLMEKYFHYESIAGETADGFDDFASPYYGFINNNERTQRIRLKRFIDKFNSTFNLYKLHGSIDNYIFNTNNKVYDMIKWEYGLLERGIVKEITTHLGENFYYDGYVDVVPEFLSGTTEKIKHYERKVYYSKIFDHLTKNLYESKVLIVIGYGFADTKINTYLFDFFKNNDKTMVVINISRPESELLDKKNVKFFQLGVEDIPIEAIRDIIGSN